MVYLEDDVENLEGRMLCYKNNIRILLELLSSNSQCSTCAAQIFIAIQPLGDGSFTISCGHCNEASTGQAWMR
jgi:hypothetical protein